MGVDYYTCANCSHNFPDCGDYFNCDCGELFCSTECGERESQEIESHTLEELEEDEDYANEVNTCMICRGEMVPDHIMMEFLLQKLNLTAEEAVELYNKENQDDGKQRDISD